MRKNLEKLDLFLNFAVKVVLFYAFSVTKSMATINIRGILHDVSVPQVMGIMNITPDSFYPGSRTQDEDAIRQRILQIKEEGATMIDIGGYSSRPGAEDVTPEEEVRRLLLGIKLTRELWPYAIISVDTFRAAVARECIQNGADIINDIAGGDLDPEMFSTVAELHVPYILMHMKGTPQTMQQAPQYEDVTKEVIRHLGERVERLHEMGVSDIILDPGFGFAKTLEHNYELLSRMEDLKVLGLPILAGVSRKSMIYRLLGTTPDEALNGTTVLNTIALQKGATILRVHDVREAVETIKIVQCLR